MGRPRGLCPCSWCPCAVDALLWPLMLGLAAQLAGSYGVDAAFMSLELHAASTPYGRGATRAGNASEVTAVRCGRTGIDDGVRRSRAPGRDRAESLEVQL